MVYAIGLTGGIASGKSAVAAQFAALGVPVADADLISRELVAPGQPALAAIVARFGPIMLRPDGTLDRTRLRQHIFTHAEARRGLEALLHPLIDARMQAWAATCTAAYGLFVIPLLVETGRPAWLQRVLVVTTSPQQQLQRLMTRDGLTQAEAQAIIAVQCSDAERLAHAHEVIENTTNLQALGAQVQRLHLEYGRLALMAASTGS